MSLIIISQDPYSIPISSCFMLYIVFIKNLIINESKYKQKMSCIVLYCMGPLTIICMLYVPTDL